MPNLYIITGPAGVGKSTISKKLSELKNKSALIEGDDIYHEVVGGYTPPWKSGNHLETFWKICISTIQIYLEDGFDVIFNYIVSPEEFEILKTKFKNYKIKFIVLLADQKTLLQRDSQRPVDCQMGKRCITLLNGFISQNYLIKNVLDTTNLSVDQIINLIEDEKNFLGV